jgi:putative membrane protein
VILLVIFVVWALTRGSHGMSMGTGNWGHGYRRDPMDIAKERYARGEITKEQFEDMKKNLMG